MALICHCEAPSLSTTRALRRAKRRPANLQYRSGFICKDAVGPEKEGSEAFLPSLRFKRVLQDFTRYGFPCG